MNGHEVKRAMRALVRAAPDDYSCIDVSVRYFGSIDKTHEERFSVYTKKKGWTDNYPSLQEALDASFAAEDRKGEEEHDTAA